MPVKLTKESAKDIARKLAEAVAKKNITRPRGGLWAESQKAKGGK